MSTWSTTINFPSISQLSLNVMQETSSEVFYWLQWRFLYICIQVMVLEHITCVLTSRTNHRSLATGGPWLSGKSPDHETFIVWHLGNETPSHRLSVGTEAAFINWHLQGAGVLSKYWQTTTIVLPSCTSLSSCVIFPYHFTLLPITKMDVYSLISLHMGDTCVRSILTGDEFNMCISGKGSVFKFFKGSLVNSCPNCGSSSCFCCHSCI